ncbi:MAG: sterol homeostasis protein [Phylliscum demangeonii]|nr:MAG: sterol homeostasis protein [Phylliscum demangeonii]
MPICIECRYPVIQLYTTYKAADDRSLGKGVRLTQCPRCKRFADKYVEHDFVVLFIDLVLIKPQVYRHLLFNRLGRDDDQLDPSILRLGVLLLLFDVYLTWARIEKQLPTAADGSPSRTGHGPILFLCLTESAAFHLTVRQLTYYLMRYRRPNSVSTALVVSSCTKLFPILMVIWDYDVPAAAKSVGWAVVVNNIEALHILLDCGYVAAVALAGTAAVVRLVAGWAFLRAVGLSDLGPPASEMRLDVVEDWLRQGRSWLVAVW